MRGKFTPALAFKSLTPLYDRITELLGFGSPFRRKVLAMADIEDGERILDVGCGTGSLLLNVKRTYSKSEVVGIDPDQDVLTMARAKFEGSGIHAKLVQGFAQALPFPPCFFDLVMSTLIFHHLRTEIKKQAIKEIYRVLREGGRFILADFGKPETLTMAVLLNLGSLFDGRANTKANLEGRLPAFLQEGGFQVTEVGSRYRGVQFLLGRKLSNSSHMRSASSLRPI